jgi:hypothetical protein
MTADASTQTIDAGRDLQQLSTQTMSLSIQTDACDLEKCRISEPEPPAEDEESKDDDDIFNRDQELKRRLNPQTPEDFAILQSEFLQWKNRQERKILVTARDSAHRQTMMIHLLDQEAKLLRKIDTLRSAASETWKAERLEKIMQKMVAAKQWSVEDGTVSVAVDTPEIARAREMKEMFEELKKNVDTGESFGSALA